MLRDRGVCNLTEVNLMGFVNEHGIYNKEELLKAQKYSARIGYRMASIELELHEWDLVNQEDRLTGCSITGVMDFKNATNISDDEFAQLLRELRQVAKDSANELADLLHMNKPKLVTAVKPSGCWTKEFTRVTDEGILFIEDMNKNIDNTFGFVELDDTYHSNGNKITKTYKNDLTSVYQITTKNGRTLKISEQHPMSVNGEWKKAKDLKIGDKLDYQLGTYNNSIHNKLISVDDNTYQPDYKNYQTPTEMSNDLAWLIGAYYANGCFTTNKRIKFSCNHLDVSLKVQRLWMELFGVVTEILEYKDRKAYYQEFRSTKIFDWFIANGFDKQKLDRIPLSIRKSSKTDVLSFIVGYADNDGCFYDSSFCIDTSNEAFAKHMQEVGEAVGISFGFGINKYRNNSYSKKDMYKIHMSRAFTNQDVFDFINDNSIKAKKKPVKQGKVSSKNPYIIEDIKLFDNIQTYDIEVENEHCYYQGGLLSHNTISQLPTISSGVHFSHSPYYIRRVRVNSQDPLAKAMDKAGFPWSPEVGQTLENHKTKVFEFPIKAPEGRTKYDVSAIEQLELYKTIMENYVDHNASNTIHVRPNEWDEVEQWVYDNWDSVVGVTFLSLDDSFYQLLPYEAITKDEYETMLSKQPKFNPSILKEFEKFDEEFDILDADCDSGHGCPVR